MACVNRSVYACDETSRRPLISTSLVCTLVIVTTPSQQLETVIMSIICDAMHSAFENLYSPLLIADLYMRQAYLDP